MVKNTHRLFTLKLAALTALIWCNSALAHEAQPVGLISLQASASKDVEADILVARLAVEAEHSNPERLAESINQTMGWATKLIQQSEDIKLIGGNYSSYPVYDKRIFKKWRGSQHITLKSHNSAALGALVGQLQQKLLVKSLGYQISPELLRQTQDQLMLDAIDQFKHRAKMVQNQLGVASYIIYRLDINTNSRARPMMAHSRMSEDRMMSKSSTPATITPGQQTIQVNASGSIQINQ